MSGHSKWSTIKRKKGAEDAKRGKIFTKIARDITLAARDGGGDPSANPSLRLAIDKARRANMPKELEGGELEEITYEAYAPHGVAMLIKCTTDNRNRALSDVRKVFNKAGGNMAEQGAVGWMFDLKGYISLPAEGVDGDEVFMAAVDAGADDVEISDDVIEVYTAPDALHAVRDALETAGYTIEEAELRQIPKNEIELGVKETLAIMNIIEQLEESDDVDTVYSNLNISDDALTALEAA